MDDFNAQIIEEFRANDGVRRRTRSRGRPGPAADTTGAKSGVERVNPVVARAEGDDLYVFASKAGAPTNPDWFHNLVANPAVTVELGTETFAATADGAGGGRPGPGLRRPGRRVPGLRRVPGG